MQSGFPLAEDCGTNYSFVFEAVQNSRTCNPILNFVSLIYGNVNYRWVMSGLEYKCKGRVGACWFGVEFQIQCLKFSIFFCRRRVKMDNFKSRLVINTLNFVLKTKNVQKIADFSLFCVQKANFFSWKPCPSLEKFQVTPMKRALCYTGSVFYAILLYFHTHFTNCIVDCRCLA